MDRAQVRAAFARLTELRSAPDREYAQIRDALVVTHLNLVRYLATTFARRGEVLDDLLQVGTLGLLKAIDRFDPGRGVEFTTFATPTVVGEIKRSFRDTGRGVKVPRRLGELHHAVNRAIERLSVQLGRAPTVAELASFLGVSGELVLEAQELGYGAMTLSLDAELDIAGEVGSASFGELLGRADPALEGFADRDNLARALELLSARERAILSLRFDESLSQSAIAFRLEISQMHVSRLLRKALEQLRLALRD